jgi:hypothetical protein
VAGIAAGLKLDIFRIHIAFNCCQMADDIGEAEFAFGIAPIKFVRRNTGDDFQRALADFFPVIVVPESKVFAGGGEFHKAVLLHVFDGLLKLFALIYFQSVADQAAKFSKAVFIDSGEVEAGLALHALLEQRRYGFGRRRIEIEI